MRLLYVANARIPTEKAHGLQIMHNCEAFADNGADVTLWTARRANVPELRHVDDPWAYYGVRRNFELHHVPCLDVQLWANDRPVLRTAAYLLQTATFLIALSVWALIHRADVYYSRELAVVLLLSLLRPGRKIAYEPHRLSASGIGRRLQRLAVQRAAAVFPVTGAMAKALAERGGDTTRIHPAHDGLRRERFESLPGQAAARAQIGWPEDAFIVGYVGRLHTMSMDKGVGTLVQALAQVEGVSLALVGGPDDMADALRQTWCDLGLPESHFLYAGQVPAGDVPLYLSAFDVCAMPFPWTTHFAYHASPLKLFEYMASGRAVVASDLPSVAEVVRDGETALLVPPGDVAALAAAVTRLRDDPDLRLRLGRCAREQALTRHTWDARAAMILGHLERG